MIEIHSAYSRNASNQRIKDEMGRWSCSKLAIVMKQLLIH